PPALAGSGVVDGAALSRRAMRAPGAGRLLKFRQRVDLAAERAGAAFAPRSGRVGRKSQGGRGHWRASPELIGRTAIATGSCWQARSAARRGGKEVFDAIERIDRERVKARLPHSMFGHAGNEQSAPGLDRDL